MFTASRSPGVRPRVTFSTSGSSYFHVPLTTVRHLLNVCTAKNWRQGMSTYRDFLLRNVYMKELINWNSHQLYPPAFFSFFRDLVFTFLWALLSCRVKHVATCTCHSTDVRSEVDTSAKMRCINQRLTLHYINKR